MKKLLVSLSLMSLMPSVQANDAAFGGSGSLPIPIQEKNIEMLNEKIIIQGESINDDAQGGRWVYDCLYTFQNRSKNTINLTMGFPFPINDGYGDITVPRGRIVKKGEPLVYDFKVFKGGKLVPSKSYPIAANEPQGLYYKQAYLWEMHFNPQQRLSLSHTYQTGVTKDAMGYVWLSYVLETGKLWYGGKIGQAIIEVIPNTPTRLCHELDVGVNKPKPQGVKAVGDGKTRKYVWLLRHFKPTDDLDLCFMTGKNYVLYYLVYPLANQDNTLPEKFKSFSKVQLRQLRNSIYARHGRAFKSPDLQAYFKQQWWYQINPNYSAKLLTDDDMKAIALIKKAEDR